MNGKQVTVLAVVAGIMVAATLGLYLQPESGGSTFQPGMPLVQGLNPQAVQAIKINSPDGEVILKRSGNGFVIPAKNDYPASRKKINGLLVEVSDMVCAEKITGSADVHEKLGVKKGGGKAVAVSFLDESGDRLVGLIKGKRARQGRGVYVRLMGEDTVYSTEKWVSFDTAPLDYCDKSLLSLKPKNVDRVKVSIGDSQYVLVGQEGDEVALKDPPAGKKAISQKVKRVFRAIRNVQLKDVQPGTPEGMQWDGRYECVVKGNLRYVIETAKKDDTYYAHVIAKGPDVEEVTVKRSESKESLEAKDKLLQASDKASSFNKKHGGWTYVISKRQAQKLRKPLSDLVENIKKGQRPDSISARHVLVSYEGAKRAQSDRSKEKARKLAETIAKKAQSEGADFAALAKKYSDGPSAKKGGSLGSFGEGKMAPAFEKAAFGLKVGEVSGVVETPFGFHVIKRTK